MTARFSRTITAIDAHAAGEPLRIITGGLPPLPGAAMLERRRWLGEHHDAVRRTLLWEPRGHADMYGAILTPPVSPEANFGVLFLTNEGYSTMCGHGIIALTTALIETGTVSAQAPVTDVNYDSPAGLIRARAAVDGDRVTSVTFRNVPAFRLIQDLEIALPNGPVRVDVCFGGAFYAFVAAADLGLAVRRDQVPALIGAGMAIKQAVEAAAEIRHPEEPELHGIYGTIISDAPVQSVADGRAITIFAESQVDRSPCGTGTSAKLAKLFADGELRLGQPYVHESVIDTTFTGVAVAETSVGPYPAVHTEITGQGFLTGFHTFVVDPDDPTRDGFLVR